MRVETKLVHAGEPRPRHEGAVAMPVGLESTQDLIDDFAAALG